jgi:hypothetical protein
VKRLLQEAFYLSVLIGSIFTFSVLLVIIIFSGSLLEFYYSSLGFAGSILGVADMLIGITDSLLLIYYTLIELTDRIMGIAG